MKKKQRTMNIRFKERVNAWINIWSIRYIYIDKDIDIDIDIDIDL